MKATFCLIAFLFPSFLLAQAPSNDNCTAAFDLGTLPTCSAPAQFTNLNATLSNIGFNNVPTCWNNGAQRDVWFRFTAPADGSIPDATLTVLGNVAGNGTLRMPQVAVYRGSCTINDLDEIGCQAAPLNVNELRLDLFGLEPGERYFVRVNDYSATGSPNSGTFKLCITAYQADIIMGTLTQTGACAGTLFDSGGPTDDYGDGENLTLTVCPSDAHQCIRFNVENFAVEQAADFLQFFAGTSASGTPIATLTGQGTDLEIQVPAPCATIAFQSDGFASEEGFKITWACSPDACATPPAATCGDPVSIALPYQAMNLNNCLSANSIADGPCDDGFLEGNDYVFAYDSPGDECVRVAVTGANAGAGIGIYSACPDAAGATCIASAGGDFAQFDPTIQAAFLENAGTYHFVFGAGEFCSPFNIEIETVTCPKVLPSAALCENALSIGGCSNTLPEIIALSPGSGDPNFNQPGVNAGCWDEPNGNYSFFFFTAGADGKFGFTVEAADPDEASDIDINVWGPIDNADDICQFVSTNQPVRSTWAPGEVPTGLADIHPTTGIPVLDAFDCPDLNNPTADGDAFVSTLPVQKGKTYVVLLDDYGEAIEAGGISINFSGTTNGVLTAAEQITVTPDTLTCAGEPLQLAATGGAAYFWQPDNATISCNNCPNPVVTPTQPTTYQVEVITTCNNITRLVNVGIYDVDLGPDVTVCNNATFDLNPHPIAGATYSWTGPNLSCYNCPTPTVSGLTSGAYEYIVTMTAPDGSCVVSDTMTIGVIPGQQPQYTIADDKQICKGESVFLGGPVVPTNYYVWLLSPTDPSSLVSTSANPLENPSVTTTYYLFVGTTVGGCPLPALDSITVEVFQKPVLNVGPDVTICAGTSVPLGNTAVVAGDSYNWVPSFFLDDFQTANPTATPEVTTTYTLTASNPGCQSTATVKVEVVPVGLELDTTDFVRLCLGDTLQVQATPTPVGAAVAWSPNFKLATGNNGQNAAIFPDETTTYTASVTNTVGNLTCSATQKITVKVDSLPFDRTLLPKDKTLCQGDTVVLRTKNFHDPADFMGLEFEWIGEGQLWPDSFPSMLAQPDTTTRYFRIAKLGACVDTQTVLVNVVPPPDMKIEPQNPYICPGASVQLDLTYTPGVTDIEWSPANGLSCTQCDDPVAAPVGTEMYVVKGTFGKTPDFGGCEASAEVTVFVRFPPKYEFPPEPDREICSGESVTLNLFDEPGTTYTWTSTDPTFGTNGISTEAQPTVSPTSNQTYYMKAERDGCPPIQDQLTIRVYSGTLTATAPPPICKNQTATLSAVGANTAGTGTYEWATATGSVGTSASLTVSPTQTTVYTVKYSFGPGCELAQDVTVTVAGEAPLLFFPTDRELCPGETIQLNNDPAPNPAATYVWSASSGAAPTGVNPTANPSATTTYKVTATLGICQKVDSLTVIRHTATLTTVPDVTICEGASTNISATGTGANSVYSWSPGGDVQSFDTGPLAQTTVFRLTYFYGDNCPPLRDSVRVRVEKNITADILCEPDSMSLAVGRPLELTADVKPTQSLTNFKFAWTWSRGSETLGTAQVLDAETGLQFTEDSIQVTWSVLVTSPFGCTANAEKSIWLVREKVEFATAFTPGGSGPTDVNNTFGPTLLRGNVFIEKFEIFNRWGEKVFSCNGCTPTQARWDGTDGKGHASPSDVYVYVCQYRRGDGALQPVEKGEVTLLR